MRILYDHQIFFESHGGISRYFIELIKGLANYDGVHVELSLLYSVNRAIARERSPVLNRVFHPMEHWDFRGQTRIRNFLWRCNLPWTKWVLSRGRFDLFHPTYYNLYFLKQLGRKPFIVTIHDMIYELFPNWYGDVHTTKDARREMVKRARSVIADSENTKKDIVQYYGISEDKVHVIHLGCSFMDVRPGVLPPTCPERYLLFVGKRNNYKNFALLVRAIAQLLRDDPELFLVCIGDEPFSVEEVALLEHVGGRKKVVLFSADDQTLPSFYNRAQCLVYPSLYEGFGFPILEAFACGCPAILSNASSFPEVAGDAAEFFDPRDELSVCQHIAKVLYDKELKADLRQKGYERLKRYSWAQTVAETKRLYDSVL